MVKFLYSRILTNNWFGKTSPANALDERLGTLIRKTRGLYATAPDLVHPDLVAAVQKLNAQVAFTMRTDSVEIILDTLDEFQADLVMRDGSQIQVLESLSDILTMNVRRFQYCCVLRRERIVLVWHDDLEEIIPHALRLEDRLLSLIWGTKVSPFGATTIPASPDVSRPGSVYGGMTQYGSTQKLAQLSIEDVQDLDEEKAKFSPESLERPVYVTSALFAGLAVLLVIVLAFGLATAKLVVETMVDGQMVRFALAAALPFLIMVGLYLYVVAIVRNSSVISLMHTIVRSQSSLTYFRSSVPLEACKATPGTTPA
jgi:hypothetical protein